MSYARNWLTIAGIVVAAASQAPAQTAKVSIWRPLRSLEHSLLFQPTPASKKYWVPAPREVAVHDVLLSARDGSMIHAWWFPCDESTGAILFCHGNAGNLSQRGPTALQLMRELHRSVLLIDYPGYGCSSGTPSEAGCYAAADAACDWLVDKQGISGEDLVLFGKSLGGGVATDLAVRRPHRALVLVKTFTSVPEMARKSPLTASVSMLVKNRFDNLAKISRCPGPIFIAHGDRDQVIPLPHAHKLYAAAPEPKRFFLLAGSGHNDPLPTEFFSALAGFLREKATDRPCPP